MLFYQCHKFNSQHPGQAAPKCLLLQLQGIWCLWFLQAPVLIYTTPTPIHIIKNKTLKQNKTSWWGGSVDKRNLGDRSRRQPGLHGEFRMKQTTTEHRQTSVCPTSDVSCSEDWACRKPNWDSSLFLSQSRTGQGRAGRWAGRREGQPRPFFILISLTASSVTFFSGSDLWIACAWLHIFSYWSISLFDSPKLLI